MDGKRYLRDLEVAMEPIGRLQEYANNAKIHTAAQIEQIKNSITEFGFNDPIAVWTNKSGKSEIVEGHGRLQAALELGMAEVPVIHLDGLTDAQRRAYTHVHNQLTMTTGWDYEKLDADIEELDFDFTELGFDDANTDFDAIEDLMEEDFTTNSTDSEGDEFTMSFVFPSDRKDEVTSYIAEIGKQAVVDRIVEEAVQWA